MKKNLLFLVMILSIGLHALNAQTKVTGTVLSGSTSSTLPGVNIVVKGTTKGTITDFDGKFTIEITDPNSILQFSFIGYESKEIAVNGQSIIDVTLNESSESLDEVMVVAYGTTKKASFTGSASVVKSEALVRVPVTSFEKALTGNSPGVQVSNVSGQPGSATQIRIRGMGSFSASNEPLYVIDGIPVVSGGMHSANRSEPEVGNLMATLNPGDIESVTILKDAAAASLYGSRAANGVVLITTKTGKKGKTKFNFKMSRGVSDFATDNFKTVSGEEFIELHRESMVNKGYEQEKIDEIFEDNGWTEPEGGYKFTNWHDEIFRKGTTENYELSASGGNEKTTFYLSGNILDQNGVAKNSALTRYSGRINLSHKLNDKIKVGVNFLNSMTNQKLETGANYYANPLYIVSRSIWPTESVRDENGDYTDIHGSYYNPIREAEFNDRSGKLYRSNSIGWLEIKPIDNLSFKTTASYDWINNDETDYSSPLSESGQKTSGSVTKTNRKNIRVSSSSVLTYDNTFLDKHHLNVIAAYEIEKDTREYYYATGENMANGSLESIGTSSVPKGASGNSVDSRMISYLSRLNYDYDNRYYFSVSMRRDGSSKLGKNNRWANFSSVSGSWRISSEKFMEQISAINTLKIRASYGTNGTLPSGRFDHLALFSYSSAYDGSPAGVESQGPNADLTWEKNKNLSAALEFRIFDRISGTVEYFHRNTKDLLMSVPLSHITGVSSIMRNVGEMENKGFEIELTTDNIVTDDLRWSTTFYYTKVRNEIVKLNDENDIVESRYIRRAGEPYYSFYMPIWAGVNPDDGTPMWKVVDENGNITDETTGNYYDAKPAIAGKADPDFFGSFGSNLSYKGFSFSFLFNFSVGGNIYYHSGYKSWNDGYKAKYMVPVGQLDRWQKPGDNATHPQRIWRGNNKSDKNSSRFILANDFLRLKDVTLSYTLPQSISKRAKLSTVRVYAQGTNLLTWAEQDLCDPEQPASGMTSFEIPNVKTYTFGLELSF